MIEHNIDKILEITKGLQHLCDSVQGEHIVMAYQSAHELKFIKTNRLGEIIEVSSRSSVELEKDRKRASYSLICSELEDITQP